MGSDTRRRVAESGLILRPRADFRSSWRFADKDELIDAIHVQQVEEFEAILNEALACPDPWEGMGHYLERSLAIQARDLGMAQACPGSTPDRTNTTGAATASRPWSSASPNEGGRPGPCATT